MYNCGARNQTWYLGTVCYEKTYWLSRSKCPQHAMCPPSQPSQPFISDLERDHIVIFSAEWTVFCYLQIWGKWISSIWHCMNALMLQEQQMQNKQNNYLMGGVLLSLFWYVTVPSRMAVACSWELASICTKFAKGFPKGCQHIGIKGKRQNVNGFQSFFYNTKPLDASAANI